MLRGGGKRTLDGTSGARHDENEMRGSVVLGSSDSEDAETAHIGRGLCNGDFIPLPNFQPGGVQYQNTCWIAAVVNLCSVLPVIADVLSLRKKETGSLALLPR